MSLHDLDTSPPNGTARRRRDGGAGTRALACSLLALTLSAGPASASYEVSGVAFEGLSRVAGRPLEISGYGLHRYRVFIKLYAMALYVDPVLPADERTAEEVIERDVTKRLELETFWAIPADIFRRLTREQIAKAVEPDEYERLAPSIEALNALYEDIEPGDRYAITYVPGRGTELAKNGVSKGFVEGERFAQAMFGIWLGEDPFDRRLRSKLVEVDR